LRVFTPESIRCALLQSPVEHASAMTDDEITALGSDPLDDEREERELTHTEIYQGELEAGVISGDDLRSDETDDANVAAEEGLAYVPR
jgi:hypothetical protein